MENVGRILLEPLARLIENRSFDTTHQHDI
jgi:hypothetical protein